MASILIAIIYLAFISLGLPDSLLGSAWPEMHLDIVASVSSAGVLSIITSGCTIISSLLSDWLTKKLGTGRVVAISVFLTASAMLAYSYGTAFWQLILFSIPYGLGAGAIDSCLNNYVALHLSSRHMSWLHCCWGIGASVSPYIMGFSMIGNNGWRGGYRLVSYIQFALMIVMIIAIPLWKKMTVVNSNNPQEESVSLNPIQVVKLKGALLVFFAFMFYCCIETLPIVWASTYYKTVYQLDSGTAAFFASLFYLGITVSRAICGFIANKLNDRQFIRYGAILVAISALLIVIPFDSYLPSVIGFVLVGVGCGPIYPSIVHSTPDNFGAKYSGAVIGVQMSFAYLGFTFFPVLFGKIAEATTIRLLPFFIIGFAIIVVIFMEIVNKVVCKPST